MLKVGPNSCFISKLSQLGKGAVNFTSPLAWDPSGKQNLGLIDLAGFTTHAITPCLREKLI